MGNSPSKTNYATSSTKNASQHASSGTIAGEELNSNEANDPDDSRSLPTQNIKITKEAPGEPRNIDQTKNRGRGERYGLEIDMSMAQALGSGLAAGASLVSGGTASTSSGTSASSTMSLRQLPTPPSYQSDGSSSFPFDSSFEKSYVLPPIKEEASVSHPLPGESYKAGVRRSGGGVHAQRGTDPRIPNYRSSQPIILRKNSHDWQSTDGVDVDDVIETLLRLGETRQYSSRDFPLSSWEVQLICARAREIFLDQPSLLRLQAPIKVVGDVHGQFTDLLRILKLSGVPQDTSYLFLGDYVDRGKQSLETMLLLLCYKIKYPDRFFMLRGNHESANVTKMYGFYDECKRRLSTKCWKMFVDVFNTLPFAAVVQGKIFCVHGGISPDLRRLSDIERIARPTDVPDEGMLTDLLWSDPDASVSDWSVNDRGVSVTFGKKNVLDFCSQFNFDLVIRGHMVVEDGYEFFAKKKFVTVFSAPNYCGEFRNWGAVMSVTTGLMCSFELLKPHSTKGKN
ncbi:LAMI_0D09780g1_1 [Lachancea mirantina]|uniref:Serine/threonine-protein phosphatase n=1 Tax=Lachancea mirantina TaxID=1230905 RepID=A0A1G4JEH6_9SACH|nr:LAMI_0D09780g1_1 [Lachancea mirantina]